ncbi:MAG: hypothetical protein DRI61_16960, partial [Chloroflexi bacterium]
NTPSTLPGVAIDPMADMIRAFNTYAKTDNKKDRDKAYRRVIENAARVVGFFSEVPVPGLLQIQRKLTTPPPRSNQKEIDAIIKDARRLKMTMVKYTPEIEAINQRIFAAQLLARDKEQYLALDKAIIDYDNKVKSKISAATGTDDKAEEAIAWMRKAGKEDLLIGAASTRLLKVGSWSDWQYSRKEKSLAAEYEKQGLPDPQKRAKITIDKKKKSDRARLARLKEIVKGKSQAELRQLRRDYHAWK